MVKNWKNIYIILYKNWIVISFKLINKLISEVHTGQLKQFPLIEHLITRYLMLLNASKFYPIVAVRKWWAAQQSLVDLVFLFIMHKQTFLTSAHQTVDF